MFLKYKGFLLSPFLLILLISVFPLASFFVTSDLIHTHDGLVHLPRLAAYYKALGDGHLPVRWAGDLNYGYGMPLFNFIYPLPYLIGSLFLFLGFGLVNSFKISISISFLLSGVFMYLLAKELFQDIKKAFLVTIFYQFAPFRLVDLLIRGSFGEVYTYAFLPLVLYFLLRLYKKVSYANTALLILSTFLLIISHNSISFIFFAIAIGFISFYGLSNVRTLSELARQLLWPYMGLFGGLIAASFYWVPAIFEHKYTYGDLFMKDLFRENWHPLYLYFIPNILNFSNFNVGPIPVQFGIFHVVGLVISIYFLLNKKLENQHKNIFIFALLIIVTSLFFMQPVSEFVWERVSFLRQFQFSWRFLAAVVFATSIFAFSFTYLKILKKIRAYYILIVLVVVSTIALWIPQEGFDKVDEKYYWNFPLNTTYYGETDVVWSAGSAKSFPKNRIEIISGKGKVYDFEKKTHKQSFIVQSEDKIRIVSHTQYFPGWRVYADNKQIEDVQFQDPSYRGEITFWVGEGRHNISVLFGESPIRFLANCVSALMAAILFVGYLVTKRYEKT